MRVDGGGFSGFSGFSGLSKRGGFETGVLRHRLIVMQRRWQIEDNRREANRYQGLNKLYLPEDCAEATRAFVEKRKYVWTGR